MIVYIPSCQSNVDNDVLHSIKKQTVMTRVVTVKCVYDEKILKHHRVAKAKTECLELAKVNNEICCIQDEDTLHLRDDNFERTLLVLGADPSIGAVSLLRENPASEGRYIKSIHKCSSCLVIRPQALAKLHYSYMGYGVCDSVEKSLYTSGWKIRDVDGLVRTRHLS